MSPWLKYLLGRIGLFIAVLLVLLPVPGLDMLVKLLIALVVSFALSWFLLRNWRDQASEGMASAVERRRAEKQELRRALSGEDQSAASQDPPADGDGPAGRG